VTKNILDGRKDRGKTVYPLRWSGGIIMDTSVTLIVFNDIFCDISAYTGTLFFLSLYMNLVQEILYKVHDPKTLMFI
jgi:hypothetical protein